MSENYRPSYGAFSSALGAETSDKIETAAFANMENYDVVWALAHASGVASDSVITLTILEATSAAGAGSATTSQTDTFTSTNTTDTDLLQAEIRGEQLSSGFSFAGARLETDNASGTEKVGVILVQGRARYGQSSLPA